MSDDLVKRLRDGCSCNFPDNPCAAEDECRDAFEAADRIEKLEAALREIANGQRDADKSYAELLAEVRIEARKALEGKDETIG